MADSILTIDTELSLMAQLSGEDGRTNMMSAVYGKVSSGEFGIGYQIKTLNDHQIKAVFFVEALHTRVLGDYCLEHMIDTILGHGHEVQLHLHVEWLWWAPNPNPRAIRSLANLDSETQESLINWGADAIERCGAPRPTALRAGGFEANDLTLAAASKAGLRFDSSYNHSLIGAACMISPRPNPNCPYMADRILEVPITCFEDFPGHIRHTQICAISAQELRHLMFANTQGGPLINILSHSFELLNRARTAANPMLLRRFDGMCKIIQECSNTITFADIEADRLVSLSTKPHSFSPGTALRTAGRFAEQALAHVLYDWRPYRIDPSRRRINQ